METTIWCPVCGQAITGTLDMATGVVTGNCPVDGEVSTSLAAE